MRWRLLPFAAVLLFVPSAAAAQPNLATLQQSYRTVLDQQRQASQLVVQLDADLQQAVTTSTAQASQVQLAKLVSLSRRDRDLFALDRAINTGLQQLYTGANALGTPEAGELLVQAALTHWAVLVRRAAMRSFHTEVVGLVNDPDCAGDLIGDELLQRYFDALFDKTTDGPARAIVALTTIARQTACLGTQQSALLASNLITSYDTLMRFLRLNGLYDVGLFVAQAAAQPLVLFFDVEKYRGSRSPLTRWFIENRLTLVNAIAAGRHAPLWHGFWLYDRRSGRVLGFRHTLKPRDENEVDLIRFYGSLANRQNLGDFSCNLSEMVQRGPDALGYFCAGFLCKPTGTAGDRGGPAPGGSGLSPLAADFQTTICNQSGPGGGGGGERGGSICGGGLALGGSTMAESTVRCLSQQVVRPGTEGFHCLAEATGFCSNPVDRLTKDLKDTVFSGVKIGSNCDIGQGKNSQDDDDLKPLPTRADLNKRYLDATEKVVNAAEQRANAEAQLKEQIAKDRAEEQAQRNQNRAKEQELKKQVAEAKTAQTQAQIERDNARKAAEAAAKKEQDDAKKAAQQQAQKKTPACPPGTPDCGDNSCTAMASQMGQAMLCAARALNPGEGDPFRTTAGGCDPTVCDPVDPTGSAPATAACLATMAPTTTGPGIDRMCWAVDCARQRTPTTGGCCGRTGTLGPGETGVGTPGASLCALMLCSEGSPAPGPFGCQCTQPGGSGDTSIGGFTPRPPTFDLLAPSAFLDTNTRSRGDTGLPGGHPYP